MVESSISSGTIEPRSSPPPHVSGSRWISSSGIGTALAVDLRINQQTGAPEFNSNRTKAKEKMKTLILVLAGMLAVSIGFTAGTTQASVSKSACSTYISQSKADSIALAAIGGGTVLSSVLEKGDTAVDWSINLNNKSGKEYEVKVNACTGTVIAIIVGG